MRIWIWINNNKLNSALGHAEDTHQFHSCTPLGMALLTNVDTREAENMTCSSFVVEGNNF